MGSESVGDARLTVSVRDQANNTTIRIQDRATNISLLMSSE